MNKLALLTVTLALSMNAPAFAHDMAAMGDMDGDSAPNAMGGQMGMGAHMVMTRFASANSAGHRTRARRDEHPAPRAGQVS